MLNLRRQSISRIKVIGSFCALGHADAVVECRRFGWHHNTFPICGQEAKRYLRLWKMAPKPLWRSGQSRAILADLYRCETPIPLEFCSSWICYSQDEQDEYLRYGDFGMPGHGLVINNINHTWWPAFLGFYLKGNQDYKAYFGSQRKHRKKNEWPGFKPRTTIGFRDGHQPA